MTDIRVAVSTVIITVRPAPTTPRPIVLPLVKRTRAPFEGAWALPGGWLRPDEALDAAARRTLAETTGLDPTYLEQLYAFGDPQRSPDGRVVSIVYWALLRAEEVRRQQLEHERAGDAPENVAWFSAAELPALAFDHAHIVDYALWRLRNKVGYSRIAHGLLAEEFTLAELREASEAILGHTLDAANFRRQAEASGTLVPTERFRTGSHRPARLFRLDPAVELADRGPLAPEATGLTAGIQIPSATLSDDRSNREPR
ncbi:NUDIX domain-containing protein [uncultured Microbacterium sp.]|uniref:NUDIX hydrolase n=1 Tax=uncultured Microbacterium sp. TaxID=191216 RepID=UPI0025E8FCEA|nr:NUDIX domain-containing protein [uncultured Microbacterium sp.]